MISSGLKAEFERSADWNGGPLLEQFRSTLTNHLEGVGARLGRSGGQRLVNLFERPPGSASALAVKEADEILGQRGIGRHRSAIARRIPEFPALVYRPKKCVTQAKRGLNRIMRDVVMREVDGVLLLLPCDRPIVARAA